MGIVRTWRDVVKMFLSEKRVEWERATFDSYRGVLNIFFQDILLDHEVEYDHIREAVSEFFRVLSLKIEMETIRPTTYNNYLRHLKAFFSWCVTEGFLPRSPLATRKRLPQSGRVVHYSNEDIQAVLTVMERSSPKTDKLPAWKRDRAIFMVQLETGMRPSEVLNLRLSDFDFDASVILVRPEIAKTDRPREVPFPKNARRAVDAWIRTLRRYKPDFQPDKHPLFCSETGEALLARSWQRQLKRYCQKASRETGRHIHIFPYGLRHHFAISFLRAGGPTYKLRAYLGHTTDKMMSNYVNLATDDVSEDAETYSITKDLKVNFRS